MEWIYQLPVLFFSIIFHEFAHGYMALRKGDDTAYLSGRLTLNPLPHIDMIGSVILPVLCYLSHMPMFGWAKPVPVNPLRMASPRRDMVYVAACGPLSNIALALAAALVLRLLLFIPGIAGTEIMLLTGKMLSFAITINLILAIFNLIPLAPLDGSQILGGLLPYKWAVKYERHIPYGAWIILALMLTGIINYIIAVPYYASLFLMAKLGLL